MNKSTEEGKCVAHLLRSGEVNRPTIRAPYGGVVGHSLAFTIPLPRSDPGSVGFARCDVEAWNRWRSAGRPNAPYRSTCAPEGRAHAP
jgi:hypothetical protein